MAHNLSEEKYLEFRTTFEIFDKDHDGLISTKELHTIMRNLGQNPSNEELESMIKEVDMDNNGELDFNEFIGLLIKNLKDKELDEEMMDAFQVIDKDGDGFITMHEMRAVLANINMPDEDVELMIKEADLNGDGQLTFEEFIDMINTK